MPTHINSLISQVVQWDSEQLHIKEAAMLKRAQLGTKRCDKSAHFLSLTNKIYKLTATSELTEPVPSMYHEKNDKIRRIWSDG